MCPALSSARVCFEILATEFVGTCFFFLPRSCVRPKKGGLYGIAVERTHHSSGAFHMRSKLVPAFRSNSQPKPHVTRERVDEI